MFNENIQSWSRGPSMINKIVRVGHMYPLFIFNKLYSELMMWTLYACLMKIFRVGHVDPLCMFDKIFRVGHMDPLCMFIENFQSGSYGPSMHF